ncbi:hypothetical protein [Microbacterium sp. NIBRBAC000506063]|uniref:hypothetical protein n=1 Tax=Microbacterium sp. NIBRBAC000506063 TaxID=2734618 RepID=UPI001BB790CE|nr:hypothetical protein [Microbacterium sp. NIBRBAC000506063]QTV79260.1 hypothetical protein KAE78_09495 [Microbacterium sp. NIBRBAC000506063]
MQDHVLLENLTLLTADPKIAEALAVLTDVGVSTGEQFDRLRRITPTEQASRKAKRAPLEELVKTAVGKFLAKLSLKHARAVRSARRSAAQVMSCVIRADAAAPAPELAAEVSTPSAVARAS